METEDRTKVHLEYEYRLVSHEHQIQRICHVRYGALKKKPRKRRELTDPSFAATLLEEFLQVHTPAELLRFSKKWWFPDSRFMVQTTPGVAKPGQPTVQTCQVGPILLYAATYRWLVLAIDAIKRERHQLIKNWVQVHNHQPPPVDPYMAEIPEVIALAPHDRKLTVRPLDGTPELLNFSASERITGACFPMYFPAPDLASNGDKIRRDFLRGNVARQITTLVARVAPILTSTGAPGFFFHNMTDAMSMCLYNQMAGASNIKICRNPHCPHRFYIAKGTTKRKPRSDRQYCDRPGCQKYCYDHPEENLGRVRRAKKTSK